MKLSYLTILLFVFFSFSSRVFSQDVKDENYQEINPYGGQSGSFSLVERWPMYPNGIDGVNQHIAENLKYPKKAEKEKVEGRVVISYVVEIDGSVEEIKIIESVNPLLDEEAKRVISTLKKWKPAVQRGNPVKTAYQQVINFKL